MTHISKSFFDLSVEPFVIASTEGYLLYVNTKFSEMIGYGNNVEHFIGKQFYTFIHPDDLEHRECMECARSL